ncbi:MAG: AAA family ATPase [Dehalococcoidales bacterium]|nr:AAA family ATPase [Dehalococcoidales bacterium]
MRYRHKDLVKIITGVRRCGKSILLNELFYRYLVDSTKKFCAHCIRRILRW